MSVCVLHLGLACTFADRHQETQLQDSTQNNGQLIILYVRQLRNYHTCHIEFLHWDNKISMFKEPVPGVWALD